MSLKRWDAKRDGNEKAIITALRKIGADVTQISGEGAPDLLVRFRGLLFAFEVKNHGGRRTKAQKASKWPVVRSVEEALVLFGVTLDLPARPS